MDLVSSDILSPSNHLSFKMMWFKEVDFLLVFRKWLQEWLETFAINFESLNTAE